MRVLTYELKQLGLRNRDGSYATQAQRAKMLSLVADQLDALGFTHMRATSLKPKHVAALVQAWREGDPRRGWAAVSEATAKNRLAAVRWWAGKVNKSNVVAGRNTFYGLAQGTGSLNEDKALWVTKADISAVRNVHVRMSLELQRAFGLRREEAIKFIPHYADRVDRLMLKASWTKGGKAREVPVRTDQQREVLKRAHSLAGRGSLIPSNLNYRQQLRIYERETARAGLSKLHGLRHAYAQLRYAELTGWRAPVAGGPAGADLTREQRQVDREARLAISKELGHERSRITTAYLGR